MAKLLDLMSTLAVSAGLARPGVNTGAAAIDWDSLPLPGIDGRQIDPASLRGNVVLVVNTASACGFTGQYARNSRTTSRIAALSFSAFPRTISGARTPSQTRISKISVRSATA